MGKEARLPTSLGQRAGQYSHWSWGGVGKWDSVGPREGSAWALGRAVIGQALREGLRVPVLSCRVP